MDYDVNLGSDIINEPSLESALKYHTHARLPFDLDKPLKTSQGENMQIYAYVCGGTLNSTDLKQ